MGPLIFLPLPRVEYISRVVFLREILDHSARQCVTVEEQIASCNRSVTKSVMPGFGVTNCWGFVKTISDVVNLVFAY